MDAPAPQLCLSSAVGHCLLHIGRTCSINRAAAGGGSPEYRSQNDAEHQGENRAYCGKCIQFHNQGALQHCFRYSTICALVKIKMPLVSHARRIFHNRGSVACFVPGGMYSTPNHGPSFPGRPGKAPQVQKPTTEVTTPSTSTNTTTTNSGSLCMSCMLGDPGIGKCTNKSCRNYGNAPKDAK